MNDLFSAPTGGGTQAAPGAQGSPGYQEAVVGQAVNRMRPAYMQALGGLRDTMQSRGLWNGGQAAQGEMGLQQDYLHQIGDVGTQAAVGGANLAEENRRRAEERGWHLQDQATQMQWLRDQAAREEDMANKNRWADLLGGVGKAAGGAGAAYLMPRYGAQTAAGLMQGGGNYNNYGDTAYLNQ